LIGQGQVCVGAPLDLDEAVVAGNSGDEPSWRAFLQGAREQFVALAVPAKHTATKCVKHHAIAIESVFEQITQMSRNEQMLRMIQNFNDRSRYVRCLCILRSADPGTEVRECLELIDLVRNQDPKGACVSLEAHMRRAIVDLPELIREARSRWAIAVAV